MSRGVNYDKRTSRWTAQVTANGRTYWLGRFDTESEADAVVADFRAHYDDTNLRESQQPKEDA